MVLLNLANLYGELLQFLSQLKAKLGRCSQFLGTKGIFTWHGHFYAIELTEKLGVETSGG
jgi:selenocysteine lyase/cysteine desulfurase